MADNGAIHTTCSSIYDLKIKFQEVFTVGKIPLLLLTQIRPRPFLFHNFIFNYQLNHVNRMKRSTIQRDSSTARLSQFTNSPSSTNSIDSIALSGELISTPLSSSSRIIRQHSSIRNAPLRDKKDVKQALSQTSKSPKELYIEGICLDGELIWLLIESGLKRILLQNCTFDPNDPIGFDYVLQFFNLRKLLKSCSSFSVQFNNCTTRWDLCDESSSLEFDKDRPIESLLFVLSSNIPQQLCLDGISSLAFVPPKSDHMEPLSYQSKQNLKPIMSHHLPNLERLLLIKMNFDDNIEDFVSISQSNMNLIYLWNCVFRSSDPIWLALIRSPKLVDSIHPKKFFGFQHTIPLNGRAIEIVNNLGLLWLAPHSSDLIHGLILSLGQDFPSCLSLDNISLLTLLPSGKNITESLSSQSKSDLKFIINRLSPTLKHLVLMGINFDDYIENFISISQLKLDLIYLWCCTFKTADPIWSVLSRYSQI